MKPGTICPDCSSPNLKSHEGGLDCRDCGLSLPGSQCASCGREQVAPSHVTTAGAFCSSAPKAKQAKAKKTLVQKPLTPAPRPDPWAVEE